MIGKIRRRGFLSFLWKAVVSGWVMHSTSYHATAQAMPGLPGGQASLRIPESLYDPTLASVALHGEAADRLCIRRLIDGWAHYADRRLPVKQAELFVPNGIVRNYQGDPGHNKPVSVLRGRGELIKALAVLNNYAMTFHFNGQSEIAVSGNRAVGETYCIAHQIAQGGGTRKLQILAIRYYDRFVLTDGKWLFGERNLIIDISDTKPSNP